MKLYQAIGFEGYERARSFFCGPKNPYECLNEKQVYSAHNYYYFINLFKFLSCFKEILQDKYPGDDILLSFFKRIDPNHTGYGIYALILFYLYKFYSNFIFLFSHLDCLFKCFSS